MDNVSIVVHKRDDTGTRAAKRLRKSGLIPGVIYGHGKDAVLIAVEPHALRDALTTSAGMHAVLDVTFEGQKRGHKAIVKELTLDRVKSNVIHVDLQEIRLDETIETTVAIHFEGEAKGVKAGGMLDESTREVTVKGLVTAIPEHLVVDVSELDMNETAPGLRPRRARGHRDHGRPRRGPVLGAAAAQGRGRGRRGRGGRRGRRRRGARDRGQEGSRGRGLIALRRAA